MVYPNGNTENYTYYADSLLKELVNKKADGSIIDNYTYDAAHNQTSKQELVNGVNKGITSYKYDNLNRLEIVEEPGRTTAYTFDMAGNRETVTVAAQSVITIYTYNDQNRLEKTVTQSAGKTEKAMMQTEICIKGKLSIKECTNRSTCKCYSSHFQHWKITYKYDNWNQLIKTLSDKTTTYAYNAEDYRVEKTVNNKLTRYLYEADKVVLETDGTGTETARNVYGTNLLYRSVEANETSPAEQYYYLYNAHGDVTALADTEGAISATYDYDAFGNIISQTGNANNSITYAGYQYDKETELYYLNARYYDSKTARFLTEDTYAGQASDPMSLNLYTYCANEPVMYSDPTGNTYAYLTDLAKAAGGTWHWNSFTRKAEITLNGKHISFNPNRFKTKNGKIVIDNGYFDRLFSDDEVSISTVVHKNNITATQTVNHNGGQMTFLPGCSNTYNKPSNKVVGGSKKKYSSSNNGTGKSAEKWTTDSTSISRLTKSDICKIMAEADDDLLFNMSHVAIILKGTSIEKELLKDQDKYYQFLYLLGMQRTQREKEYNDMVVEPILFGMMMGFAEKGLNLAKAESEVNTILQGNTHIASNSSQLSNIKNILKNSKPVYKKLSDGTKAITRLETELDDGSKVIFRKEFGTKAHKIGSKYPEAVDHYNIEIHVPFKNGYKSIFDAHIVMDASGKVIDLIVK